MDLMEAIRENCQEPEGLIRDTFKGFALSHKSELDKAYWPSEEDQEDVDEDMMEELEANYNEFINTGGCEYGAGFLAYFVIITDSQKTDEDSVLDACEKLHDYMSKSEFEDFLKRISNDSGVDFNKFASSYDKLYLDLTTGYGGE